MIADTHVQSVQALSTALLQAIKDAECVVHCGDFVNTTVVNELRQMCRNFVGVYGNADPDDVRHILPPDTSIICEGKSIAVIHPFWGGYPAGLEDELTTRYPHADAILFGHTHETCNKVSNGTLLFNPGQAYASFMVPATVGILTVTESGIRAEIQTLD